MEIRKALYIKLGEGGCWERDCIQNNKIRIGWKDIALGSITGNDWDGINELIKRDFITRGKKTGWTNDFNALKSIIEANEQTVFITFSAGKMYWTRPKPGSIAEDEISKYLETIGRWSCENLKNDRVFEINQISGRISKLQGFMGTACNVNNRLNEFDYLKKIINGQETNEYRDLLKARTEVKQALIPAIKNLTPKDFEILIDLIFRNIGWKRTSVLGEVMKFFDLVLEEPLSKNLHGVQIKSESSLKTYQKYIETFETEYSEYFRSLYYFVHTPDKKLEDYQAENENEKLMFVPQIADLAIDYGLINWIMDKSK